MHISDGVLSLPVLVAGFAGTAGATALTLKRVGDDDVPRMAVMTAAFFVASLIHVPVGPVSAHLILNGLAGVILGAAAFPAILIGLTLQAMLFQHGGLTTLGVNACVMGLPALAVGIPFGRLRRSLGPRALAIFAGAAGAAAIALSGLGVAGALATTDERFVPTAKLVLIAHVPVMIIESIVTGTAVAFLLRVKPELIVGRARGRLVATLAAAITLAVLALPGPASAHRLLLEVLPADHPGGYRVEAFYSDGRPAAGARVEIGGIAGGAIAGATGPDGAFNFEAPGGAGPLHVVVDAGLGHRAESTEPLPGRDKADEREERTRTPWARAALGVAIIAAGAFTVIRARRRRPA